MDCNFESMDIEDELHHHFINPQQKVATNIIFTSNWILNRIAVALKPTGLSLQQFNVLSILHGQPNQTATVNLIKDRLIDRMPNVSRLVNKLMEKGLIEKERNVLDQRVVYIKLTAKGLVLKDQARGIIDQGIIELNKDDSNVLNTLLEKVRKENT
ncbi:MarR family winged helix-turn-helix transcriptional regulator [Arcticibacter svalbardensis]|nr:MarR family transcriptional regulator [Arcticibacter svalbardensis]